MSGSIKEMLKERHDVVEVLKKLKTEKTEIEGNVEKAIDEAFSSFTLRAKHNNVVAELKKSRNKNLNKGGKRRNQLVKQFKDLERRFESGQIPYNRENQTMKRLGDLQREINSLPEVPDDAGDIHEELTKNAEIASGHNTTLNERLEHIADLSVTYEALIRKRAKLHSKFEALNDEIKIAFDAKAAASGHSKVDIEEKVDSIMSLLQAGETVNITDLMWGGQ